jgi:hypothetical protein
MQLIRTAATEGFKMWEWKQNTQQEDRDQDGKVQVKKDVIEKDDKTWV